MSYPIAKPLAEEDISDLREQGFSSLVVLLDGTTYNSEDLYHCSHCDLRTVDHYDLNEDGLCVDCEAEARAETEHLRQLNSDLLDSLI